MSDRSRPLRWWRGSIGALSGRQVNLLLAVAAFGATTTGLISWGIGTGWGRWWTILHATLGFTLIVLTPAKIQRSVRPGLRRRRSDRWISIGFGVMVTATVVVGLAHSSGLWVGVGYWSSLWTHVLLAFLGLPVLLWHMGSRSLRPHRVDANRRLVIGGLSAIAVAASGVAAAEASVRLAGLRGGTRRFTGSHETGSFDPDAMPTVSWLDDTAPERTDPVDWPLTIAGAAVPITDLVDRSQPLAAVLDCTGGWWSEQRWDVISIAELLPAEHDARSFTVTSATGYARIFPITDAATTYLAVGYDGRPLRRGHGAPVRLVAPARRGPWWVKWVRSVDLTDRPWWAQLPFPPT